MASWCLLNSLSNSYRRFYDDKSFASIDLGSTAFAPKL